MRYATRTIPALALLVAASAAPAAAQTVEFGGQLRPRFESRGGTSLANDSHASLRTRLHLAAEIAPAVHAFVQIQDVRIMGEEEGTMSPSGATSLDVHQAYIDLGEREAGSVSARVGRQEAAYGGERLVGAVNWAQQARSFDGVRGRARLGAVRLDAFAFQIADATAPERDADEHFLGLYSVTALAPGATVDAYLLHDRADGPASTEQTTVGMRHAGRGGPFEYRVEAAYQAGRRAGRDVRAHLLGLRLGADVLDERASLRLWYDRLSGDDDPTDATIGAFHTLYATNHKFYGYADLFVDVPAHTGGRGLQDIALRTTYRPADRLDVGLDTHLFRLEAPTDEVPARLAEELDLTARYRYDANFTVTAGVSYVVGGPALARLGRPDGNQAFGYLMLDATF